MKKGILILPEGFDPPEQILKEKYYLEALAPKHNEMDYEAWSSSKDELRGIFGPKNDWPFSVTSLEQNRMDLESHYREFKTKVAFAYTILNLQKTSCIGCVYINPTDIRDYDARVDFWFRKTHLYIAELFHKEIDTYLETDWGMERIVYPGRSISWYEYEQIAVAH